MSPSINNPEQMLADVQRQIIKLTKQLEKLPKEIERLKAVEQELLEYIQKHPHTKKHDQDPK